LRAHGAPTSTSFAEAENLAANGVQPLNINFD